MTAVAKQSRRILSRLLPLLLLMALAAGFAQQWVGGQLQAIQPGATQAVTVTIPSGASVREMAALLETNHLIRDATVFRYFARYRGVDSQLKPGEYQFTAGMNLDQILSKLARGETVVHRFTIPEGKTLPEIADILAKAHIVDRDKFLQAAAASHLADAYLPKDVKLELPLEGYLFPDTYEYKAGVTEADLLAMMFARFEKVWTPENLARAKELNLSVHQVMTLASIVEKEAQVAKERPVIAGVYHNRMDIGMKLDADPTVGYAVKKTGGQDLSARDLTVDSPYNTYTHAGLPPGPIAAPGEASIKAALFPEKHDYWYFVAKEDGSGEHYFAATLDEQDHNIAVAHENAAKKQ